MTDFTGHTLIITFRGKWPSGGAMQKNIHSANPFAESAALPE
jgi:hypothetical protein